MLMSEIIIYANVIHSTIIKPADNHTNKIINYFKSTLNSKIAAQIKALSFTIETKN